MNPRRRIAIVEDDTVMRETLAAHLGQSYEVFTATNCTEARALMSTRQVGLAILDLNLPDGDGLDLIDLFRNEAGAEVVVVTAYPRTRSVVAALKAGAFDYINKPFELDEFDIVVAKAFEVQSLRNEVVVLRRQQSPTGGVARLLGDSPPMKQLRESILRVAATPSTTVLIRGESGTGKELVVEAIHHESRRRSRPLVRLNCSSIPATMLESELFGHERGAFTDAKSARKGLIEIASGGTLFLDEIGDLPMELQPKLLRVLESHQFRRLGGNREIEVDVRFVSATNRNLEAMVEQGAFREDLLFRLKVFEITVPPLRERRTDTALLVDHFVKKLCAELDSPLQGIAPEAIQQLYGYSWPGNAREMKNVIERAVIIADGDRIELRDLPADLSADLPHKCIGECPAFPEGLQDNPALSELERRYILCVYDRAGRNKTRAAEVLGISRVTLREKLKRYGEPDS